MRRVTAWLLTGAALIAGGIAGAGHDPLDYVIEREIEFVRPNVAEIRTNLVTETLRVNLDLSVDGGSNWVRRLAHGLPAAWGTNTYNVSLRVTPEIWTERARIAVRTLWSSTGNEIMLREGDMSETDFTIAGVRIVSPAPGAQALQPGYLDLTWHEAGSDWVDVGISVNGGASYDHLATRASTDPTNTWAVPIIGYPEGPARIVVMSQSNLWHTVDVEIVNQ